MCRPADNTSDRIKKRHHDRRSNLARDYKAGNVCDRSKKTCRTTNYWWCDVTQHTGVGRSCRCATLSVWRHIFSFKPPIQLAVRRYHVKILNNWLRCSHSTALLVITSHVIRSVDLAFYSAFVTGPKPWWWAVGHGGKFNQQVWVDAKDLLPRVI